jgi:hypothetical protein
MKQLRFALASRCPRRLRDARSGDAGRAARHWPSASPFRLRLNYAVPSGLSGNPASACRATARKGRKLNALLAALLFAAFGAAQAKSITALTPSFFDVNKAIGSAVDGDTVIIPAGTASWTPVLAINKAITLMGQTTTDSVAGTAADKTIVQYNHTDTRPLINVQSVAGKVYRISGITFQSISSVASQNGFVVLSGYSQKVRVDHCHFALATSPAQAQAIRVSGAVRGVADHNVFEHLRTQTFGFYNGGSPTDTFGNTAWSQPTAWGSEDFFYVEDNYIKNVSTSFTSMTDGDSGCRFVIRHNHCYNVHIANHGTEGVPRGGRAMEIYGNDFHNTFGHNPGGIRSGCLLFYNNTWDGTPITGDFAMPVYRVKSTWGGQQLTGWGGADGSSPWDVNETEGRAFTNPPGAYVEGHAPFQYFPTTPGTWATAGTGTTITKIVDSTDPRWTTDQWKHFGILKRDGFHNEILNTTNGNSNLVDSASINGRPMGWAPGSQYQIHKCLVALDQEGRGQGDLVKGSAHNFFNSVTGKRAWPHQVLDPVYSWNNHKGGGANMGVQSAYSILVANRDYYNQAAAVGGVQQTGVGVGTLTNRPASGKNGFDIAGITPNPPGTAYWATDVPSINGSTDKGALYVWRGGAWVLYYQPYTYPHPLVGEKA